MNSFNIKELGRFAMLVIAITILQGCPVDPTEDLFATDGDIQVNNSTGTTMTDVYIAQAGSGGWGSNRVAGNAIGNGGSRTFTGFDCSVSWDMYVIAGGALGEVDVFTIPCGGTETVTWN